MKTEHAEISARLIDGEYPRYTDVVPKESAINIEANAEMIKGNQVSAAGGLVDFLRGARRSKGGRAVVALVSTTSDGKTSRIVPALAPGTSVSIARSDVEYVITENGIADLRNKTLPEKAEQLIEIAAAPQFRDELRAARDEVSALRRR